MSLHPDAIARGIHDHGWIVVPAFLSAQETQALRADLRQARDAGQLRPAGVGHGDGHQVRAEIRADRILWLNETAASPAQHAYFARMDELRQAINRETFLGLFDLESHFASYPPDSFYRRHLDRFRDDSARTVSCILYLNEAWRAEDGGQLRLYLDEAGEGAHVDIDPVGGTLVVFLSDRFWHEVLPTARERLSVTGWFRTRA